MKWEPDTIAKCRLDDGYTYYARLLEFPWAVFYKCRSKDEDVPLDEIVKAPVLFTIAVHKSLLQSWKAIGKAAPDPRLRVPEAQAIWDSEEECQIIDASGNMRPATPAECRGLEPAAVWEPEHVADRLKDAFAGRPNQWFEDLIRPI